MNGLKQARENKGVTQDELALAMGVSRQTIISIEQGKYQPRLPLAFVLADYFATSVEALFREKK